MRKEGEGRVEEGEGGREGRGRRGKMERPRAYSPQIWNSVLAPANPSSILLLLFVTAMLLYPPAGKKEFCKLVVSILLLLHVPCFSL
jgi:hypothetical protein